MVALALCILAVPLIALVAFCFSVGKVKLRKWCWEDETEHWKAHAVSGRTDDESRN